MTPATRAAPPSRSRRSARRTSTSRTAASSPRAAPSAWTSPDFGSNWNPYNVDGNNNDLTRARTPLLPTFFDYDTKGNATPNPNFVVSAEETNANPTTVNYKLNPEGRLG